MKPHRKVIFVVFIIQTTCQEIEIHLNCQAPKKNLVSQCFIQFSMTFFVCYVTSGPTEIFCMSSCCFAHNNCYNF